MKARAYLAGLAVLMLIGAGCSSKEETPGPAAGQVNVELKEYTVAPAPASAAAGSVTFVAKNSGTMNHEMVVVKTELAPDKLPLKGSLVDEEGAGIDVIDEIAEFAANTSQTKQGTLVAGNYVLICNVAGHYQLGMHAAFKVT